MSIILWIISSFFSSIANSLWKKAVLISKLPQSLFSIFGPIWWILIVYFIIFYNNKSLDILLDYKVVLIILFIAVMSYFITTKYINIYKNVKLSDLLPYKDLDKVFVVLFWFLIFYWTKNGSSITSFFIILTTIFVIILSNVNIKKIHFSKYILQFFFVKILEAINTLLLWYIFLKYTTIEYLSIETLFYLFTAIVVSIIQKNNLKLLFTQEKEFYKYRLWAWIVSWIGFIISLYIAETSWILIATLLSFIWLVFNIFSMKFILNDTPEKKQIILAVVVMVLIWVWFYFK